MSFISITKFSPTLFFLGLMILTFFSAKSNAQCLPECREGFTCENQTCVSPCNPMCQKGEVCSRNGHCINEKTPYEAPQVTSTRPSTAAGPANPPKSTYNTNYSNYNSSVSTSLNEPMGHAKYLHYKQRYESGKAILALGIIGIITAGILAGVAVGTANDNLLLAASLTEIVFVPIMITGIVKTATSKGRMRTYSKYAYTPNSYRLTMGISPTNITFQF